MRKKNSTNIDAFPSLSKPTKYKITFTAAPNSMEKMYMILKSNFFFKIGRSSMAGTMPTPIITDSTVRISPFVKKLCVPSA